MLMGRKKFPINLKMTTIGTLTLLLLMHRRNYEK